MQNLIVTASIMYCAGWQFGFEAAFGWLWCWSSAMHPTYHANSVIFPLAQCRAGSRVARSRSTKGTLKSKLSPCIWTSNVFLLRNKADRFHSTEGERGEGDRRWTWQIPEISTTDHERGMPLARRNGSNGTVLSADFFPRAFARIVIRTSCQFKWKPWLSTQEQ